MRESTVRAILGASAIWAMAAVIVAGILALLLLSGCAAPPSLSHDRAIRIEAPAKVWTADGWAMLQPGDFALGKDWPRWYGQLQREHEAAQRRRLEGRL